MGAGLRKVARRHGGITVAKSGMTMRYKSVPCQKCDATGDDGTCQDCDGTGTALVPDWQKSEKK